MWQQAAGRKLAGGVCAYVGISRKLSVRVLGGEAAPETVDLCQQRSERCWGLTGPQTEQLDYLWGLFIICGEMKREVNGQIGAASADDSLLSSRGGHKGGQWFPVEGYF